MTRQQLADLSGVSRQTVSALEQQKVSPSLEVTRVFAFGIGLEQEYVLDRCTEYRT